MDNRSRFIAVYILPLLHILAYVGAVNVFDRHGCPDGWVTFGQSCYLFAHEALLDWTEAEHSCDNHFHSSLVEIDSSDEHNFLRDFAKQIFPVATNVLLWTGATDDEVEGVWVWRGSHRRVDAGYHAWYPGEPDNVMNQDCGCLLVANNFAMGDTYCDSKFHFICEKNVTETTTGEIIG